MPEALMQGFGRLFFGAKVAQGRVGIGVRIGQPEGDLLTDSISVQHADVAPATMQQHLLWQALAHALLVALQQGLSAIWVCCQDVQMAAQVSRCQPAE